MDWTANAKCPHHLPPPANNPTVLTITKAISLHATETGLPDDRGARIYTKRTGTPRNFPRFLGESVGYSVSCLGGKR